MSSPLTVLRKALVTMSAKPLYKQMLSSSRALRQSQETLLRHIISENRATAFGRDHAFDSITTFDDYRRAVPIGDFETHRPYIDRMCQGAADVLFPGRPLMYNTTSGTTEKPKLIPVSADYFRHAYRDLSRVWLYACLLDNPSIYDGFSLSAVAPEVEGHVADGTPFGSISGAVYRNIPAILKGTYSTPYAVICIKDYQKKYYAMMRWALGRDITFIISPSPSNLLQFHATVMAGIEDLVRDIRDGTLREDVAQALPSEERGATLAALRPDPVRARLLEALFAKCGSGLRPHHYWPNLQCINLWKEGNFARVLPQLDGYYPEQCVLRSFGYQASEARAGMVFANSWDYSALMAHTYLFEFIEEGARSEANPCTLLAHELETGKRYYILFSNGSGLYRYDINDIIEVIGFWQEFPLFRFIQKGEGVTSLTGEKLTEYQLVQAVERASAITQTEVRFFTMVCDEERLGYTLYVEFEAGTPARFKETLLHETDRQLREMNPEYEVKRGSKRLAAPTWRELQANSARLLKETLIGRNLARDGQYKETLLTKRPVIREILEGLVG